MRWTKVAQGVPPAAPAAEQTPPGPMAAGRYTSIAQFEQDLKKMGPHEATYEWFRGISQPLGKDDSAKDALVQYYRGDTDALGFLYDIAVEAGLASPIDEQRVESVMEQHPEVSERQARSEPAGLFLPPANASIHTTEEGLQKLASGGLGGGAESAYSMHGDSEKRMCPKIRNVVSTFTCRYHCLDGLVIDDHQILCGEAIWRQAVMDKFSTEYRDKDGNWVGGYLNKRFLIEHDDGGHPALLKPGQRHAPIHEDAWVLEKRLQEMRRTESTKRGYSTTPGDPKDLYNFDQHDLAKGPKPQSEKKKDPIAKIAESGSMFEKTAGDDKDKGSKDDKKQQGGNPFKDVDWARPEPQEGIPFDGEGEKVKPEKEAGKKPFNLAKRKEQPAKQAFNLKQRRTASNPGDPMMSNKTSPQGGKKCRGCGMVFGHDYMGGCTNCGAQVATLTPEQASMDTGGIKKVETLASTDLEFVNGVYRATRLGKSEFGATVKEALSKLDGGELQENADDLLKLRQEEGLQGQMPQQAAPVAPEPPVPLVDPTPTTEAVPMSAAPAEPVQEEPVQNDGLFDPAAIDEYLAMNAGPGMQDEEEAKETELQANMLQLGPDN